MCLASSASLHAAKEHLVHLDGLSPVCLIITCNLKCAFYCNCNHTGSKRMDFQHSSLPQFAEKAPPHLPYQHHQAARQQRSHLPLYLPRHSTADMDSEQFIIIKIKGGACLKSRRFVFPSPHGCHEWHCFLLAYNGRPPMVDPQLVPLSINFYKEDVFKEPDVTTKAPIGLRNPELGYTTKRWIDDVF